MADINTDANHPKNHIPSRRASEALIKEYAQPALDTLEKLGATDLIDALGLRPHVKDKK
jgi:hypothetical protein